ncbi:MAG TPA: ComF family protein [Bacteroidales bacterium]|nr:ComF family protein [Bacteroidales bacterium]
MKALYDLVDDFLGLLFPRMCYGCGNHLLRNEKVICTECRIVIPRTGYHETRGNPVEQLFWGRCMITRASAFSFYSRGSRIRKLIHNLKYNGIEEIGTELGNIYGASLKSSGFLNDIDLLMPVPLHPSKERSRGFNQSLVICKGISSASGIEIVNDVLTRPVRTSTQTKKSRYDRWTNVEGIFRVGFEDRIAGKHILLVDDVITTGSTLEACVNELLKVDGVRVSVTALACAVM